MRSKTVIATTQNSPILQRKCACGSKSGGASSCPKCGKDDDRNLLQRKATSDRDIGEVPPIVYDVLRSPGQPLDTETRAFFEPRFGQDFSRVRVHIDHKATESANEISALAYAAGNHIAIRAENYAPTTSTGKRLLAHELTHVVQQSQSGFTSSRLEIAPSSSPAELEAEFISNQTASAGSVCSPQSHSERTIQRQVGGPLVQQDPMDDPRMHPPGAPNAKTCSPPSWCPVGFCQPFANESFAIHQRTKMLPILMAGIAVAVDSRVVPLWHEHLLGGATPKNLTSQFSTDFSISKTTLSTNHFLVNAINHAIRNTARYQPAISQHASVNIQTMIGPQVNEIGDAASPNQMNFNIPGEVPGNLAGGIGADQTACSAGKRPSPFNDSREASGDVVVIRLSQQDLLVVPDIKYRVRDTIDLCPGDCGTSLEQFATVPISQFEATGISGDVPFEVEFASNILPYTLTLPLPPSGAKP
ncbi:MAG: DUF4157 domain-containing protein [Pirellulales bacterium]